MKNSNKNEIVYTILIHLWWSLPIIWLLLLSVVALQEGSSDIYIQMGWIIFPFALLSLIDPVFIRHTEIEFENRSVIFKDGIGSVHKIEKEALKKITWDKSFYILEFDENHLKKELKAPFIYYLKANKKRIISKLVEFNPSAQLIGFELSNIP